MKNNPLHVLSVLLFAVTCFAPVAAIGPGLQIIAPKPNENFQVNVPVLLQGCAESTH